MAYPYGPRAAPPPKAGGGVPPVTKSNDNFLTNEGAEISTMKAIAALQRQAYAQAGGRRRKGGKGSSRKPSGFQYPTPTGPALPPPPTFSPIINPYQSIIAGIGGQVQQAQGRVQGEQAQATQALRGLGGPTTEVPGASLGDVGGAASASLQGLGSDISGSLRSQMAQFIIRQIQQRQQIQADYLKQAQAAQLAFQQQNQFTPDMLRQLIASGINPNTVDTSNPFAIAAALGKAQAGRGNSGLSLSTITQLTQAGIDYRLYENDPKGAAEALGKAKRNSTPSDALLNKLIQAANS